MKASLLRKPSRFTMPFRHLAVAACAVAAATGAFAEPNQKPVDNFKDLEAAINRCWVSAAAGQPRLGGAITVRLSLKRNGELLGLPRVTFEDRSMPEVSRDALRRTIAETIAGCLPVPLTDGFGGAVAGRPFTFTVRPRSGQRA